MNRSKQVSTTIVGGVLGLIACGGAPLSTRIVETPHAEVVSYGAPHHMRYSAEVDSSFENTRITLYRSARCDVIPIQLMQRYEEKLEGDQVVERTALGKREVAGKARGSVACDHGYAPDVDVMLEVGDARHALGRSDARGVVTADLSQVLKSVSAGLQGKSAKILIRPLQAQPTQEVGVLSFDELRRQQEQVGQLVAQLNDLFKQGQLSQQDSALAYELYAKLQQLAPGDPRTEAISLRFWELVFQRRQLEATAALSRNLDALAAARETLKAAGDAALPIYMQVAVSSGQLDTQALSWASLRLISALRGNPTLCSGGFSYARLASLKLPADVRLAAQYFEFAYNGAWPDTLTQNCGRF